jgi:outer membrane immunogenic protein
MRSLFLRSIALVAVIAGPAMAADMPVKAPVYKAPPVAVYSWTGFYIGAHVGGDWFNKDWFVPLTPTNIAGGCVGCPISSGSHTASSWLAGGQIGFNYQVGWWVGGIEAQASWTKLEGSNPNVLLPATVTNHSKTDDLGTIAARLGVAWDRTLLYVKGGGAWAHDTFWTSLSDNVRSVPVVQTVTDTRWGWMVGVGVEYAFWDNWSVKLEYDHLDFSRNRETVACVAAPVCAAGFDYDIQQRIDLVKIGLNYRFGYSPVVAKY